ncbi:MAG: folylpolyglutamate synthase/dihydrofolate synthase family protein [Eubacteriales bacterium]|nr:folylpolyglutamate synthase/dihydrofolate synthase family protein [Eubacteriales bacterium]
MTYEEAVDYIESVPKFTKKNAPENTVELMERLGRPERKMKLVHVAGTNGKGSVCSFIASMLTAGKKETGLFISPHLVKINERFQINNVPVSDEEFLSAYLEVKKVMEEMIKDGFFHPTYFEILFAICMVIFRERKVEYAVLETGLGGRLDTTNVVEHPMVTVITSISLDHTEILGDTVEKIAWEKAGIIKEGVPVIYDGRNEAAAKVIRERAEKLHAPAKGFTEDMYRICGMTDKSIDFMLNVGYYENRVITAPYPAPYQAVNSSLALMAMETVDPGHEIAIETRLKALAATHWQGRMETVLPGVIVDGAHNEDGIREFVRTLNSVQEGKRIVLLFSAVVEKNYERMIETICNTGRVCEVIATEIHGSRIVPAGKLAEVFRKYTKVPVTDFADIREAFETAREKRDGGLLFCVGSLYLVGAIKEIIEENRQ